MTRRLARLLACAGVVTGIACIDITVDGSALGSLQFVSLPYPSVDVGDTLRDARGVVAPLTANVFRADNTPDPAVPVSFLALDTGLTILATTNTVVGRALPAGQPSRSVRVIASAAGLQTPARTLLVVPAPDTLGRVGTRTQDTIAFSLPAAATDTSRSLTMQLGVKNGATVVGVPGYIVRYTLRKGSNVLPASDTTQAFFFVDQSGRLTKVDTSDNSGFVSRNLRFRIRQGQAQRDTVEVLAEARRGGRMARDTIRWTVVIIPK
ncbi:MAG: hypothetical protein IT361_14705 [Gemmatimonadaceae bacterium]|nr:hypothetical protein [Gemmatimonadaceae bacterium]